MNAPPKVEHKPLEGDKLKQEIMSLASSQVPVVGGGGPNAEEIKELEDMLDDLI